MMRKLAYTVLCVVCISVLEVISADSTPKTDNDTEVTTILNQFNSEAPKWFNIYTLKLWELDNNITDYNEEQFVKQETLTEKLINDVIEKLSKLNTTNITPENERQIRLIKSYGETPNNTRFEELSKIRANMETTYLTAEVCVKPDECLDLDQNISSIMMKSRDYDELLNLWVGWRNETGRKIRQNFTQYVDLENENARLSGYKDNGDMWRAIYETNTLESDVYSLYQQILPLYKQLHSYVRRKLMTVYGKNRFPSSGHIPAHILGNMWAQEWDNIFDILIPYENETTMDVTSAMKQQNYTTHKIFKTAEDFFVSLGFEKMNQIFWDKSILEKPKDDRQFSCARSSWDFNDGKDFRVKMCTEISQEDLIMAHRHVAHIQYFMAYKDQPFIYKDGANDAFLLAFGDLISLSVETFEHMKSLNLVNNTNLDNETDINLLMKVALLKVAFLPFGYMIDNYRWSVFRGEITPDNYTKAHWSLRCDLQGISPPVRRTESDFDAGAKYHVAANEPYIKYFLAFIMQFQFHEAVCKAANHRGPLHKCDITNSKETGDRLREFLKLGASKPWPEILKLLTGKDKIDAKPLLDYFQPLMDFLVKENGDDFGWSQQCPPGSF